MVLHFVISSVEVRNKSPLSFLRSLHKTEFFPIEERSTRLQQSIAAKHSRWYSGNVFTVSIFVPPSQTAIVQTKHIFSISSRNMRGMYGKLILSARYAVSSQIKRKFSASSLLKLQEFRAATDYDRQGLFTQAIPLYTRTHDVKQ